MKSNKQFQYRHYSVYQVYDAAFTYPNCKKPRMTYCIGPDETPYRVRGKLVKTSLINTSPNQWINTLLQERIDIYKKRFVKYRTSTYIQPVSGGILFGFLIVSPGWAAVSRTYFLKITENTAAKTLGVLTWQIESTRPNIDENDYYERRLSKSDYAKYQTWMNKTQEARGKCWHLEQKIRKQSLTLTQYWPDIYHFYSTLWEKSMAMTTWEEADRGKVKWKQVGCA
jgi:hypothetical protein